MGEFMSWPGAERMLAQRANRFFVSTHKNGSFRERRCVRRQYSGFLVMVGDDVAHLAEIEDMVPDVWDCEVIPSTDDGF